MIFGGTENKEKVWEYEQMYASKEELKWLKSFNRVSRIIDRGSLSRKVMSKGLTSMVPSNWPSFTLSLIKIIFKGDTTTDDPVVFIVVH